MKRENNHKQINVTLPKKSFERAEKKDVKLVEEIVANIASQYNPMETIAGLKIVM